MCAQRANVAFAIHGSDPAVWDRARAFRSIGFDRCLSIADFPANAPTDGRFMADSAMTDETLAQLDDRGSPQFLFAISIEAHGSYDVSPGVDTAVRDAIRAPASVTDPAARLKLRNYCETSFSLAAQNTTAKSTTPAKT
jgi:phosphoglycerol transferase MdoB-like AlkP superfamily enzyme